VVVVFVYHLRSDIVGCAQFFVEVTLGVVDKRRTEIDDLDLIELFVLLKKDVLWLEITMDDVGPMAVIDARKYLLHKHGCITL